MKTDRRCRCCTHPRRAELDLALMRGATLKAVAQAFGVPISSASRHRAKHLVMRVVRPGERPASELERDGLREEPEPQEDRPRAADVARALRWAAHQAGEMMLEAKERGDIRLALHGLRVYVEAAKALFETVIAADVDEKISEFDARFR